jgi:hypothetical protein
VASPLRLSSYINTLDIVDRSGFGSERNDFALAIGDSGYLSQRDIVGSVWAAPDRTDVLRHLPLA